MFTVRTERPTQSVGGRAALMLGAIAALAITAFALAVPHSRHVGGASVERTAGASHVRFDPVSGQERGGMTPTSETHAGARSVRAERSNGAVP